ncbi:hypothetical protein EVAR_14108_1 [Eumeta japonica]|uniref:Uncharacterized protein n=1 Tax=Eumeta variegata TaxID=151549 RepID=A0A4C1UPD2_EUMVA|nr:hypothetical protein EVAR_14108_1 [Eumeta japonica]
MTCSATPRAGSDDKAGRQNYICDERQCRPTIRFEGPAPRTLRPEPRRARNAGSPRDYLCKRTPCATFTSAVTRDGAGAGRVSAFDDFINQLRVSARTSIARPLGAR